MNMNKKGMMVFVKTFTYGFLLGGFVMFLYLEGLLDGWLI